MANPNVKPAPAPSKDSKPRVERTSKEKAENFDKAAPARVDRILKAVASLRSIARPVRYSWTDADREQIFAALADALKGCEAAFRSPGTAKSTGFTFKR